MRSYHVGGSIEKAIVYANRNSEGSLIMKSGTPNMSKDAALSRERI
jgi:hypothetical protein